MAWTQTANIRGASGTPGASGATGPAGASGPTGATGASGGTGGTGGPGTTNWNDIVDKPGAILNYKGTWNASTNTPTLSDGTGSGGDVYRVSVGASRNLGSGTIAWDVGDYAIWSPVTSSWEKADTTDAVSSVAGRTGAVTLTSADLGASGTASSSNFLRGDNTWAVPTGITRSISTITSNTTLASAANTDYVVFANIAPTGDLLYNSVSLLLNMDGTNASTTFTDASTNSFTVTANGNAKISTAHSKFGGASALFDGTGDFLTIPDNAAFEFGSSNLTWEMWLKTTSSDQYDTLLSRTGTSGLDAGEFIVLMNNASATAGDIAVYFADFNAGAPMLVTTGASVRDDAWHHIAIVRNGSAWAVYIDGTSRATATWAGSIGDISNSIYIGGDQAFTRHYNGYIDSLRLTKAQARYTANFTAPTAAFPAFVGTAPTVTLPTATGGNVNEYRIKNIHSTEALTLATTSSQTIDGAAPGSLSVGSVARYLSDGSNWRTV